MKTNCPHCTGRIRWWHYLGGRRARGERRFLPNRAITVCPLCRRDIAVNIHPLEHRLQLLVFTPVAIGLFIVFSFPGLHTTWIVALAVLVPLMVAAAAYMHWKTRDWQRFRRHQEKP